MTRLVEISKAGMKKETGFSEALGYSDPKNDRILIRDDLDPDKRKEVLAHEEAHMMKGEEGPFLQFLLPGLLQLGGQAYAMRKQNQAHQRAQAARAPITGRINALMGGAGTEAYNAEIEQIKSQPGYDTGFNEGIKALETGAGASGNLFSGETAKNKFGYGTTYLEDKIQGRLRNLNAQLGIANQDGQGYVDQADAMGAGAIGMAGTVGNFADRYSYWKGGNNAMNNINSRLADINRATTATLNQPSPQLPLGSTDLPQMMVG